ncbi:hypothetical protein ElyMa_001186400 [Elysia marginata]|uniref:Uncharacterized protein n=1 Tax=Elysia marginata TaxID=1093978 RepID=A0AAV4I306_9GAST|nr:hypothetical protein ElyMa_001186400 [Elysia marginata]
MLEYVSFYYSGGGIGRRPRPRSLCARCGGIAQDEALLSTRPRSTDRGPCNLSIEVDGREGRQGRRRNSSTGRDVSRRGNNPLCFIVATGNGRKAAGSATTYRESFQSPPVEELKARKIRSLPSSPITASVASPRTQRKALARQMAAKSEAKIASDDGSPPLVKQTDCSPSLISLLNNETDAEVPRPTKGRGNPTAAAKGKAHQPLWTDKGLPTPPPPRRSAKGLAHQPLWAENGEPPNPTPRRPAKGLAHQPLWSEGADATPTAPAPRRSVKGFAHQPLWTETPPDVAPVRMSRRAAARSVSESEVLPAAGIKTQPPSSLSNSLTSWVS